MGAAANRPLAAGQGFALPAAVLSGSGIVPPSGVRLLQVDVSLNYQAAPCRASEAPVLLHDRARAARLDLQARPRLNPWRGNYLVTE